MRSGGGEVLVIIEVKELFVEGWVVGEDAGGVVVNMYAVGDGFEDNALLAVR